MADSSVATCTANGGNGILYRHSRTDETIRAKPGECLPRRRGLGGWFALTRDNPPPDLQPIIIGHGLMWVTEGGGLQSGDEINIWYRGPTEVPYREGRFRVTDVKLTSFRSRSAVHIQMEYVGAMDPAKLVHLADLLNHLTAGFGSKD